MMENTFVIVDGNREFQTASRKDFKTNRKADPILRKEKFL